MIKFRITFDGTAELLMHNGRLANPLDPATKALKKVNGKRQKTEDDYWEIARTEYMGGLYIDRDMGPYIPGDNIHRCLFNAAKKHRWGGKIKEGVFIDTTHNPLSYDGPRTAEALWENENFRHMWPVANQRNKVLRTRPMFRTWSLEADGTLDTTVLDFAQLETVLQTAGAYEGLGDWRPRYGRFVATVEQQ